MKVMKLVITLKGNSQVRHDRQRVCCASLFIARRVLSVSSLRGKVRTVQMTHADPDEIKEPERIEEGNSKMTTRCWRRRRRRLVLAIVRGGR